MEDKNQRRGTPIGIEPAYIRDLSVPHQFDFRDMETLALMFQDERTYCEHCGSLFALWPPATLARHVLDEHAQLITNPVLETNTALLPCEWGPVLGAWVGVYTSQRISLRRAAHRLGLISLVKPTEPAPRPAEPSRIIKPN